MGVDDMVSTAKHGKAFLHHMIPFAVGIHYRGCL
jgi:hypothetical protein